uniref:BTB domain-containing protein n=1 Tax=Heliothis virescens TaxID=7102 RepID=A0A2A4JI35_HELVI
MAQSEQLSLSWDAHQKNICRGLSVLQQRGEFVDMTLAADGHHVKVHQMVMSLVSPYIKDLISTAQCPHPIIFLNNISYTVLCSILEYVYTGEVLVPKERLDDLIAAGKALHIKGLREMEKTQPSDTPTPQTSPKKPINISEKLKALRDKKTAESTEEIAAPQPIHKIYLNEENDTEQDDMTMETQDDSTDVRDSTMDNSNETQNTPDSSNKKGMVFNDTPDESRKALMKSKVQYTLSNQGGLLTIYNRYVYRLQYVSKKNKQRRWRCINYNSAQCRAHIFTNENDMVTERLQSHNHPFHDKKILRSFRQGLVFSVFENAAIKAQQKKLSQKVTNL